MASTDAKKGGHDGDGDRAAAPPAFEWKRWPETEAFVDELIATALAGNAFAATLAERMPAETGTRFTVWVDHLVVTDGPAWSDRLEALGYERQPIRYAVGSPVFAHPGGIFPRIAVVAAWERRRGRRGMRSARSRSRSSRSRRSPAPTTWAWRSSAIRWGPTGSAGSPASGRRWPWSSAAATWASSRSPATWPARAG